MGAGAEKGFQSGGARNKKIKIGTKISRGARNLFCEREKRTKFFVWNMAEKETKKPEAAFIIFIKY